ncbi:MULTISPECIES: PEPxxWA-CTERM sorting domain-containing protein [unclassified Sphingomonas]|uniref:PEPxxWA-CTERM sorting domain-containing protein n=1 Tax=unclassified Sphingomonas TaxID=196159 RepID=UPI001F59A016|nr:MULTISPECIES: PEPxxWA-CTERM sorting domain-containing protein [unclassified Sphingomonas]
MTKAILFAAAATAMALVSTGANAAANLVSAAVTGSNGSTVWNTTSATGFYTVFLQQPYGKIMNPEGQAINDPTEAGLNSFTINGDGWPIGGTTDSDPSYTMTLKFADGATISGIYQKGISGVLDATSSTVGDTTYTFTGFAWDRSHADNVSGNKAVAGGDTSDYAGQFSFSAVQSAVPEPTTWAMMLAGFGMIGLGLRSRRKEQAKVAYA